MKVLIVEDDEDAAAFVVAELAARGFEVHRARDGREGLSLSRSGGFDVLIIDRLLPKMDGLSLISTLRADGVATPALFLTNLSGIEERVEGLSAGADDYLVKPFAVAELVARLEALARRPTLGATPTKLSAADIELDLIARTVKRGQRQIDLQPREFQLLEYFMRNAGRVVTRKMLLEQVWGYDFEPHTNIVETHVSRLRAKLDEDFRNGALQTVRGVGYTLRAQD